jgi:hypothetical protein
MPLSDIENRYLNTLAEQQFPTMEAADMATEMVGGMEPEGATPMSLRQFATSAADVPAGLLKGAVQGTIGLPGDIESLAYGVRELLNRGADETRIGAFVRGLGEKTILPTTEDVKKWIDTNVGPLVPEGADQRRLEAAKIPEFVGELGGAGRTVIEGTKAVARGAGALSRGVTTAANLAGDKAVQAITGNPAATSMAVLEEAGRMSPLANIMPKVTAQGDTVVPVKVGERQVELPINQAAILSKAVKNLTPAEQAKFKSNTAKTFVENLTALPSKQEFGAAALAGAAKKGWYEGSTQAIVNVFGPDANRFAALLSATSPQTSVESNLYNALQIWKNWTAAGRPVDRDSIVRVMGESVQGGKGEESVLDAWVNNSVRALSAEDPGSVMLSGPKVDSFMRNLQGNVNEVTNDAWMASFALVDQKIFSGSLTKTDPGKGPGYLAMNARVRETADYLTKLTGETWTPAEVQETIWSWAKTLYETAGSAGETRSAVQLIRDSAITNELIASTPDFRTLFYDQRFQPILEQAGYGDQLAKLRAATTGADGSAGGKKPGAGGQAGAIDPEAQRKLNERNAKRLDKLRKQREEASAQKAAAQTPPGGNE